MVKEFDQYFASMWPYYVVGFSLLVYDCFLLKLLHFVELGVLKNDVESTLLTISFIGTSVNIER